MSLLSGGSLNPKVEFETLLSLVAWLDLSLLSLRLLPSSLNPVLVLIMLIHEGNRNRLLYYIPSKPLFEGSSGSTSLAQISE